MFSSTQADAKIHFYAFFIAYAIVSRNLNGLPLLLYRSLAALDGIIFKNGLQPGAHGRSCGLEDLIYAQQAVSRGKKGVRQLHRSVPCVSVCLPVHCVSGVVSHYEGRARQRKRQRLIAGGRFRFKLDPVFLPKNKQGGRCKPAAYFIALSAVRSPVPPAQAKDCGRPAPPF